MSTNSFGKIFRFTTFGESHGPAIGVVIDGVPPNFEISESDIQAELDRRKPGQSELATPRAEADKAQILSGVFQGRTTGAPLMVLINNKDHQSSQYDNIKDVFRPGHADFTYFHKYGNYDYRGGGRASARETACRVVAGAVAKKFLSSLGISVKAATVRVKDVVSTDWNEEQIEKNPVRCADAQAAKLMEQAVLDAKQNGDSLGGIIECRVSGAPAGLGEPVYGKLDAELAYAMMSIGATRGCEFGQLNVFERSGIENNDAMEEGGKFCSNRTGGILGGISTGEMIYFRVIFKATSSVGIVQSTSDKTGSACKLKIDGRHDPCILPRAVPVVEAMTNVVLADLFLRNEAMQVVNRRQAKK